MMEVGGRDNMSSIIGLGIFKKLGLFVAIMLGLLLCSSMVHAGLTLAPDFTLTTINGSNFTLSGNRGRVILIDFFATWCGYCLSEMAELKTVYNHFGSSAVLISVDSDDSESNAKISGFASNNGIPWIMAGGGSSVYAAYWHLFFPGPDTGIPKLFIIDQNGYMKYDSVGYKPGEASHLINEIDQIMPFIVTLAADGARVVVGRGSSPLIDLTLENRMNSTATINATVYANTITIYTKQLSLPSGDPTTLTFGWDTTGFTYGNYTLSARVAPVSGGTNTTDCNVTGGWAAVTIPGDVDGDFSVGLLDLVVLAKAYGSKPGNTNWNPNADVDGNGEVGLSDLVLLAHHYGQHYP
jgi:thiol-disulfide isomerase/thioredoxin